MPVVRIHSAIADQALDGLSRLSSAPSSGLRAWWKIHIYESYVSCFPDLIHIYSNQPSILERVYYYSTIQIDTKTPYLYAMSTFMTTRPGTPFPSTESISYFSHVPSSSSSSRRLSMTYANSHPIHFQLPSRPVLTPPSLLQRTSSSGSSSSYHLSRTPSASAHSGTRRSSASSDCASSVSSPMPTTPTSSMNNNNATIIEESDIEEITLAPSSSLSPNMYASQSYFPTSPSPSPKSKASRTDKFVTSFETIYQATSTLASTTTTKRKDTSMPPPSRPVLKRRDTPRPKTDYLAMAPLRDLPILSPVDENLPKRRFTSMVDGKSWVVVA